MHVIKTNISDLLIIEPKVFEDKRGYFYESFKDELFKKQNLDYKFVQDNQSKSTYGVIRGLHFQTRKFAQAKLVRAIQGEILDVAVDLRSNSRTFGKHFSVILSEENKKQLLIPRGFAHGFSVLSKTATTLYKCDNYYNKDFERRLKYNDKILNIDWIIEPNNAIVSEKDLHSTAFDINETYF